MLMADQRVAKPPRTFNEWRESRRKTGGDVSKSRLLNHSPRHDDSAPAYVKTRPGRQTRKLSLPPSNAPPHKGGSAREDDIGVTWLSATHYQNAAQSFYKYDPSHWLPTLNFVVTPFMLWPWALVTAAVTVMTLYVEWINPEMKQWMNAPIDAHVVMGGALSFLVVFRTNASYDRWWEARCAWQTVITTTRTMAATSAPSLKDEAAVEQCLMQLMAFVVSLKAWLRDAKIERHEIGGRMDWRFVCELNEANCPPLMAIRAISKTVRTNLPRDDPRTRDFDEATLGATICQETSEQLRVLSNTIGQCERIKLTPMTYGYIATLRSFLVLWLATLPLALVGEYGWLAPPALSLIAFLFLTVEQMAIEIEQPFGDDANDLPLEDYIANLETTLLDFLPGRSASNSERLATALLVTPKREHATTAGGGGAPGGAGAGAGGGIVPATPHDGSTVPSPSRVKSMVTSTIKRVDYEYEYNEPPPPPQQAATAAALNGSSHALAAPPVPPSAPPHAAVPGPPPPIVVPSQHARDPFPGQYASYASRLGLPQRDDEGAPVSPPSGAYRA